MNINTLDTEILDNTTEQHTQEGYKQVQPSEVSVLVEFELSGEAKKYSIEFQTSETSDYGAFSDILCAFHDSELERLFNEYGEDEAEKIIEEVKEISGVQEEWRNYVNEHFILADDRHCNFIDGNSIRNVAYKKEYVVNLVKGELEKQKKSLRKSCIFDEDGIKNIVLSEDDVVERVIAELEISEDVDLEELRELQHAMIQDILC